MLDITLVKSRETKTRKRLSGKLLFQEEVIDCRTHCNMSATGQLDMGISFDCFDALANTANFNISGDAKKNRKFLTNAMGTFGFVNYPKEWWHFTLENEPFQDTYFDFMVK